MKEYTPLIAILGAIYIIIVMICIDIFRLNFLVYINQYVFITTILFITIIFLLVEREDCIKIKHIQNYNKPLPKNINKMFSLNGLIYPIEWFVYEIKKTYLEKKKNNCSFGEVEHPTNNCYENNDYKPLPKKI